MDKNIQIIQEVINVAVQRGLFSSSIDVINVQTAFEQIKQALHDGNNPTNN
jgi:hypothetical protein